MKVYPLTPGPRSSDRPAPGECAQRVGCGGIHRSDGRERPLPAIRVLPVEREGRELPPHEALAVECDRCLGEVPPLLTSEHGGAHRVAGYTLEEPLATLSLEGSLTGASRRWPMIWEALALVR